MTEIAAHAAATNLLNALGFAISESVIAELQDRQLISKASDEIKSAVAAKIEASAKSILADSPPRSLGPDGSPERFRDRR